MPPVQWDKPTKVSSRYQALNESFLKAFGGLSITPALAPDRHMVSCGGEQVSENKLVQDRELASLLGMGMLRPEQYISVEYGSGKESIRIHRANSKLKGPVWKNQDLLRFCRENHRKYDFQVIYADLMKTAVSKIGSRDVTDYFFDIIELPTSGRGTLYVGNFIYESLRLDNSNFKYPREVWNHIQNHPRFESIQKKRNLKLINNFKYDSPTYKNVVYNKFETIALYGS